MKKFLCVTLSVLFVFLLSSCSGDNLNDNMTKSDENPESSSLENATKDEVENITGVYKIEYGEDESAGNFTGFKPLPPIDFKVSDPLNERNLSTDKITHSFGVATSEKPNEISINSQKYFDERGFNALTVDLNESENAVYLTFDVGYDNGYTDKILDTLKEKNVKAAFFCTVDEMESDPQSIARMIKEGHIVGNHTKTHPSMDELSRTEMMEEIKAFDDYIRANFGYSAPYFRFPKGEYSDCALDLVGSLGYMSVFWSLAYDDWDTSNQRGSSYALKTVTDRIHPGAVILLHAVSKDNADALGDIIDSVKDMGYKFKTLDEYEK